MANEEILVVEDESYWQRELKRILENAGYVVSIAKTYTEAVEVLKRGTTKLAVIDLSLDLWDRYDRQGVELMKEAKIPMVCVSGTMAPGEGDELFRDGLVEWYFRKRDFAKQVDSFLAQVRDSLKKPDAELSARWEEIEREQRRRLGD